MAAKTKVTTRRAPSGGGQSIVVVEPRTVATAKPEKKRRGRSNGRRFGGVSRASKGNRMIGVAIGGAAYGFIEKSFPTMPTLPLLGKSGTVALAVYFLGGQNEIINDIGIAAAAIAGYSLGKTGMVSGYDDSHGLAAEM